MKSNTNTIKFLDTVIRWGLYFLLLVLPFVFSKITKQNFLTPKLFVFQVTLITLIIIYMFRLSMNPNRINIVLKSEPLIFFALAAAASFTSIHPGWSMMWLSYIVAYFWYAVLVGSYLLEDKRFMWTAILITGLASALVSLYGFLQYFGIDPFFSANEVVGAVGKKKVFSTFGNPNFLTYYLDAAYGLLLGAIFAFIKMDISKLWKIDKKKASFIKKIVVGFLAVSFMLNVFCIVVSSTRGAYLAMLVSTPLFLLLSSGYWMRGWLKKLVIVGLILIGTAFVGLYFYSQIKGLQLAHVFYSSTIYQRILMWWTTLKLWFEQPFTGTGLGTFRNIYPLYQFQNINKSVESRHFWWRHGLNFARAHNDYLDLLESGGIFLLMGFLFIFARAYAKALKVLPKVEWEDKFLILGSMTAVTAVLTHTLVEFPFQRLMPTLTLLLSVMIMADAERIFVTKKSVLELVENNEENRKKVVILPMIAIIFLGFYYLPFAKILSNINLKNHLVYLGNDIPGLPRNERMKLAGMFIDKAYSYFPYDIEIRYQKANYELIIGNLKKAGPLIEDAFRWGPSTFAHGLMGMYFLQKGDIQNAKYYFRKGVGIGIHNKVLRYQLISLLMRQGMVKEALREALEFYEMGDRTPETLNMIAECYVLLNDRKNAEYFIHKIPQNKLNKRLYAGLANLLLREGKYKDAVDYLNIYLNDNIGDLKAQEMYLFANKKLGNWKKVLDKALLLISKKPNHLPYYVEAANAYYKLGDLANSIVYYKQALAIRKIPVIYDRLIGVYVASGKIDKAIQLAQEAYNVFKDANFLAKEGYLMVRFSQALKDKAGATKDAGNLLIQATKLKQQGLNLLNEAKKKGSKEADKYLKEIR